MDGMVIGQMCSGKYESRMVRARFPADAVHPGIHRTTSIIQNASKFAYIIFFRCSPFRGRIKMKLPFGKHRDIMKK